MLSNNADQFMTTPMRYSVTTQANGGALEMPAPRPSGGFIPGIGNADFMPGMGEGTFLPGVGVLDFRNPTALLILGAVAVGGWMLLKGGKGSKSGRRGRGGPGKVQFK